MGVVEGGEGIDIELEYILTVTLFHLFFLIGKALYQQFTGLLRFFVIEQQSNQ